MLVIILQKESQKNIVIKRKKMDQMWRLGSSISPLPPHCKEIYEYVFLFWELRSLSPNFHIQVSVSNLYIPRICPHISLQQNRQTNPGNI
jgi:hypothetical protein